MSLEAALTLCIPFVVSVTVSAVAIVLMFKLATSFFQPFRVLFERTQGDKTQAYMDLETGTGLGTPAVSGYHITWTTPRTNPIVPILDTRPSTPTMATSPHLCVIERPAPRSPNIMTSLVSPLKTACSPSKVLIPLSDKRTARTQASSLPQVASVS
ncbi:hypothetical protein PsorP6_013219 [Peronosclerospora sorghi]|uniref:Uncharacterized protein n=1 Tax=Peronosclerospora sorghi TaxID=230839 RepID=A0ACC0WIQ2_9STRA|nr:hypothetical protein PsorP6_013219 [Peronosclerospora sorghi]